MKIDINSMEHARSSLLVPKVRLIAGFTLSPTMGALAFYVLLNVPVLFGYELPGISLSTSPSFLIGGLMTAGTLFYAYCNHRFNCNATYTQVSILEYCQLYCGWIYKCSRSCNLFYGTATFYRVRH